MAIAEATNLHPEDLDAEATFRLSPAFLKKYKERKPAFGFGGFGELVYMRTYSRIKSDGKNEVWWETVRRVVEGTYRMQERHIKAHNLGWDSKKAQQSAQEMFERIFSMKFLPPGRGLWAMGSDLTETRGLFAALNNCAFRSTAHLAEEGAMPFIWQMDASMLGIGVGFDTKGAGQVVIQQPGTKAAPSWRWRNFYPHQAQIVETTDWKGDPVTFNYEIKSDSFDGVFVIPDTREGWVVSVMYILDAYFQGYPLPRMDYSQVRPENIPIKGFGGVSSGPEELRKLHQKLIEILVGNIGAPITVTTVADIENLIGACVVAGNVRRTALIAFGQPDDEEYLSLKDHWWNPLLGEIDPETGQRPGGYDGAAAHRADFSWTSNNSVFCEVGQDYTRPAAQTAKNGEPGYAWLDNMRAYGRMGEPPNFKDHRAEGGNPCLEQTLEDQELCCLVETFPHNHDSLEDYQRTLKFAYLYAKTVTLGQTHWPGTNRVMLRNRRIGASMSGVQQFLAARGLNTLREWCEVGYETIQRYDRIYSDWFAVPLSIKTTSIKPSGTVSLLAGATPGCHWPEALHYLRRMRLSKHSDLVAPLKAAGYHVEPAVGSEDSTLVVAVPVKIDDLGGRLRTVNEVSLWEQVSLAAFLQRYWADNQVSCTVTFRPEEADQIEPALNHFQYSLKGISFLPKTEQGKYPQMPYEEIPADVYEAMVADLKPLEFVQIQGEEADVERFCDGERCQL